MFSSADINAKLEGRQWHIQELCSLVVPGVAGCCGVQPTVCHCAPHSAVQAVCDKHDPEYWPKFKKWCDDYFVIKHGSNERRGCAGIFFDDLNDKDADTIFDFS